MNAQNIIKMLNKIKATGVKRWGCLVSEETSILDNIYTIAREIVPRENLERLILRNGKHFWNGMKMRIVDGNK